MSALSVIQEHIELAQLFNPDGINCGWCGATNDNADDMGWWYYNGYAIDKPKENRATCLKCEAGPIGQEHIKRHGIGER